MKTVNYVHKGCAVLDHSDKLPDFMEKLEALLGDKLATVRSAWLNLSSSRYVEDDSYRQPDTANTCVFLFFKRNLFEDLFDCDICMLSNAVSCCFAGCFARELFGRVQKQNGKRKCGLHRLCKCTDVCTSGVLLWALM